MSLPAGMAMSTRDQGRAGCSPLDFAVLNPLTPSH